MAAKRLLVETYEYDVGSSIPDKDLEAYQKWVYAEKHNMQLSEGRISGDPVKLPKAVAQAAERVKEHRKQCNYCLRGFPWRSRIVDAESGEVVFEIPRACQTRWHADRYGQRFIKRYEKYGSFTEVPLGPQVSVGSQDDE